MKIFVVVMVGYMNAWSSLDYWRLMIWIVGVGILIYYDFSYTFTFYGYYCFTYAKDYITAYTA
jgi:hypothetical protein